MIKLRIALANKDATAAQRDELKRIIGQHLPIVEIKPQPGQILASLDWHVLLGDIVNIITVSGWIWKAYTKLAARPGGRLIVMAKGEKSHDWENFVLEHDNQSTPEEFAGKFSSAISRIHESESNDIPDDHGQINRNITMNQEDFTPKRAADLCNKLAKLNKKSGAGAQQAKSDDIKDFNEALSEAKSAHSNQPGVQAIQQANSGISNSELEKRAQRLKDILVSLNISLAFEVD